MDQSEEDGNHSGLGWIPGKVKRFQHQLKIPQMGWNQVLQQKEDPLFHEVADKMHFYFVHSYHLLAENSENVLGLSSYGYNFASVVRKDNLWGVQFHPEKSQNAGLQLLKNFCTLT
jgi:glutamine amidotransferase